MRESLEDLVRSMPTRASRELLPELQEGGIVTYLTPETPYVWPDVILSAESDESPSPVILIAAPGAMGKSAAAKNIAFRLETIYVDLAQLRVGSGSLTGELTKALGFKEAGMFVEDLKAGRASIMLDSTDEAQLGVGRENYVAFLGDLMWLLLDAKPQSQVVLLGRRDATDTTLLGLMDLGLVPPLFQIAPLSHTQACELIDQTLDKKRSGDEHFVVHRQHPIPFGALRDGLFRSIGTALEPGCEESADYWDDVDDFLGYPPVLLALAERLAVDNPAAELDAGIPSGQRMLRGELLKTILERILDREHEKVRSRIGDSLGMAAGSAERNVLYTRDEQVARLLSATGTSGITLDVPAILDESDRAKYEDNLASFIIDHPFLKGDNFANVVFRDYVRAWAISSAISGLYSSSRQEFLSTLPPAGPFFAHFLHSLSVDSASALGTIPEDLVDDAIHSFALGTDIGHTVYFHRDELAVLVLHGDPQSGAEEGSLAFRVTDLSGVVVLRSPLARLLFVSSQSLILRGHEGTIDIGPEVSIVVQELEIEAKTLTAFGAIRRKRETFNMISAGAVRHDGDLSVSAIPAGALSISWPDAWHQWKPMLIDMGIRDPRIDQATVSQVLLCLRRVITSFRSSMQDAPSVSADKMDRIIIGTNPVFVATLAALENLGVVSRESALFRVSLDSLAHYGVSWADLHGDDPVSTLKKILAAVVASPEFDAFKS